ncbi:MAG: hypothetical protein AVDCRST_MAG70-1467, partial [uncultured Thermomicrobiales bacterium]
DRRQRGDARGGGVHRRPGGDRRGGRDGGDLVGPRDAGV